jgi:hypothetical protein
MKGIEVYETTGVEKAELHKRLVIPEEAPIHSIKMSGRIPFNFMYTSLTEGLARDADVFLAGETNGKPNAFTYAMEDFTRAFDHMLKSFSAPQDLACFSGEYPISIFLAKDFDEFCTIGRKKKWDLPAFAKIRTSRTDLVYLQDPLVDYSRKPEGLSEYSIQGSAHELLHIFSVHHRLKNYGKLSYRSPFLLTEGLTVICGRQVNLEFDEDFISAEHLFLRTPDNIFEHDDRWITKNRYYQSAGHLMNHLLKAISEKEGIAYNAAFQRVFTTTGCPESFDSKGKFSAPRYFKEVFGLDLPAEYEGFLKGYEARK